LLREVTQPLTDLVSFSDSAINTPFSEYWAGAVGRMDVSVFRFPAQVRAESTPTPSHSEDTLSSHMYSEEEDEEIVASDDEDEQESPEDYCKGKLAYWYSEAKFFWL